MTEAIERDPFDPADPMDAMAEMFRRQVTQMVLDADKITLYRELNPQRQIECFIAGALTGIVGVGLCSVKSDGYDAMMEYMAECLPHAREMAENIRSPNGEPAINHHDALVGQPSTSGASSQPSESAGGRTGGGE